MTVKQLSPHPIKYKTTSLPVSGIDIARLWQEIVSDQDYAILLERIDSCKQARTIIALNPIMLYKATPDQGQLLAGDTQTITMPPDPFSAIDALLPYCPTQEELPPEAGSLIGFVGFNAVQYLENIPIPKQHCPLTTNALLMIPSTVIEYTAGSDKLTIHSTGQDEFPVHTYLHRAGTASPVVLPDASVDIKSNMTQEQFMTAVTKAKHYIAEGEAFQIVLSQRFQAQSTLKPAQIYSRLRTLNPSPYMFHIAAPEFHLIGCSPEALVQVKNGTVCTEPIAGTRPRGKTQAQDQQLEAELLADPKERAEHVMLVDLARNDIARVALPGSVKVDRFMTTKKFSHVMHIASSVTGSLCPKKTTLDAFKALFPAGTVTGAPKIRAMELISELETDQRGPYAGAVGFINRDQLDMAIAIRFMIQKQNAVWVQAGAGIVTDSVPKTEYKETLAKARALLASLERSC